MGLGGTWDNTNVIDAEVAVVTPIGLDHTQYLGDTVSSIATEKAGIIKADSVAVLAAQPAEAAAELLKRATEVEAAVAREGLEFGVLDRRVAVGGQFLSLQGLGGVYDEIFLPLHGAHQAQNAAVALAAVEAFFGAGAAHGVLDIETVRAGFAQVRSPGRLEAIRSAPTILLDAAHNPSGLRATLVAVAEAFEFRRLVGGGRGAGRQGRRRDAGAARTGRRRVGRHPDRLRPRTVRRRAGRARGAACSAPSG